MRRTVLLVSTDDVAPVLLPHHVIVSSVLPSDNLHLAIESNVPFKSAALSTSCRGQHARPILTGAARVTSAAEGAGTDTPPLLNGPSQLTCRNGAVLKLLAQAPSATKGLA